MLTDWHCLRLVPTTCALNQWDGLIVNIARRAVLDCETSRLTDNQRYKADFSTAIESLACNIYEK